MKASGRMARTIALMSALGMFLVACAADEGMEDTAAADESDEESTEEAEDEAATDDDDTAEDEEAEDEDAEPADRRVLRVGGESADIQQLDPHYATTATDRPLMRPMFEGLIRAVPGNFMEGFEPAIALEVPETPEPNPDGTQTWEFEIREGVMCHEGPSNDAYELTAEDVVFSYEKAANPDASGFSSEYSVIDSIEAVDDNKVAFHLSSPRSAEMFLPSVSDFGGGYVVCSKAVDLDDVNAFQSHPVGTGPFMFAEYNPGSNVVLEANDDYWRGPPRLAGIEMVFMADESSRTMALQSGELDFISGVIEDQWIERIDAEEGFTAMALPDGGLHTYSVNKTVEPFDDIRVRQAFFYAQDRDAHVAVTGPMTQYKAWALETYAGHPGSLTEEEAIELGLDYSHDPERARELLEEAGLGDGFSFSIVSSEFPTYSDHYQVLQANLAEVGIDMEIEVVDHATYHSLIRDDHNAITLYRAPRTMDLHFRHFAHSDAIVGTGSGITNFSHFDLADDLIDAAAEETDAEQQAQLWKEANIKILEDAAIKTSTNSMMSFAWRDGFDPGHEPVGNRAMFVWNEDTDLSD